MFHYYHPMSGRKEVSEEDFRGELDALLTYAENLKKRGNHSLAQEYIDAVNYLSCRYN